MPPNVSAAHRSNAVRRAPSSPMSPAVLASLRSVMQNPTNDNVHSQTVALANALRESGVQDVSWVPYLLLNMKKVAGGEDRAAVDWVRGNLNSANSVVPGVKNAALAMVNQAERIGFEPSGRSRTLGDVYGDVSPQKGRDGVARFFDGRHSAQYRGQVVALLRENGLSTTAANAGGAVFGAYNAMRSSVGFNDKFYKNAAEVQTLAQSAFKKGAINQRTRDSVIGEAKSWLKKYPQAESAERLQAQRDATGAVVDQGKALVSDLEYLQSKLDGQGGMHMAPLNNLPGFTAESALKKLPMLRGAVASGDPDRIKRAMAEVNGAVNGYGDARKLGDRLVKDNDDTLWWMQKTADLASVIPGVGPAAKILLTGSVEGLKAMSGKQTAAQALTNTALAAVNLKLGKLLSGSGAGKAILASINGSVQSFAKDAARILSDGKGDISERLTGAARKAVIAGFKSGIESQAKVLAGDSDLRKTILAAAIKFGIEPEIKPLIDKFGEG